MYLASKEGGLSYALHGVDIDASGTMDSAPRLLLAKGGEGDTEANLSAEEKLRRERQRILTTGVTSFARCSRTGRLLVPMHGDIFLCDAEKGGTGSFVMRRIYDKASATHKAPNDEKEGLLPAKVGSGAVDARFSADGRLIAFVQDRELYVIATDPPSGEEEGLRVPHRITFGARERSSKGTGGGGGVTNGLSDYLAQEELNRYSGFWWSPQGDALAYEEVDERHMDVYTITHQGKPGKPVNVVKPKPCADAKDCQATVEVGNPVSETHCYPFAGGPNPRVKMFVQDISALRRSLLGEDRKSEGKLPDRVEIKLSLLPPVAIDPALLPPDSEPYIARVNWLSLKREGETASNGGTKGTSASLLTIQLLDRLQHQLQLIAVDHVTGKRELMVQETSDVWINVNGLLRVVKTTSSPSVDSTSATPTVFFLWGSERTAFMHIYLYAYRPFQGGKARLVSTVTRGDYVVEAVSAVVGSERLVLFMANADHPTERHLYAAVLPELRDPYDGGSDGSGSGSGSGIEAIARLTPPHGFHAAKVSPTLMKAVISSSSMVNPPFVAVYDVPSFASIREKIAGNASKTKTKEKGDSKGGRNGKEKEPFVYHPSVPIVEIALTRVKTLHQAERKAFAAFRERVVVPRPFSFEVRPITEHSCFSFHPLRRVFSPTSSFVIHPLVSSSLSMPPPLTLRLLFSLCTPNRSS